MLVVSVLKTALSLLKIQDQGITKISTYQTVDPQEMHLSSQQLLLLRLENLGILKLTAWLEVLELAHLPRLTQENHGLI